MSLQRHTCEGQHPPAGQSEAGADACRMQRMSHESSQSMPHGKAVHWEAHLQELLKVAAFQKIHNYVDV